jgi:hypothetical protein
MMRGPSKTRYRALSPLLLRSMAHGCCGITLLRCHYLWIYFTTPPSCRHSPCHMIYADALAGPPGLKGRLHWSDAPTIARTICSGVS